MILESAVNKGVSVVLTFKMRRYQIILVDDEVLLEKESPSCWDAKLCDIIFEASNGEDLIFLFTTQHQ
jgi:hypothetical protein